MRRGFSLIEVTTVIVILAVAITIAIPRFTGAKRRSEQLQAVTYLRAIRLAELMHFSKAGSYSADAPDCAEGTMGSLENAAEIDACLGTAVTTGSYNFSVTADDAGFEATAEEIRGDCTITLFQAGSFTTSPDCRVSAAELNT